MSDMCIISLIVGRLVPVSSCCLCLFEDSIWCWAKPEAKPITTLALSPPSYLNCFPSLELGSNLLTRSCTTISGWIDLPFADCRNMLRRTLYIISNSHPQHSAQSNSVFLSSVPSRTHPHQTYQSPFYQHIFSFSISFFLWRVGPQKKRTTLKSTGLESPYKFVPRTQLSFCPFVSQFFVALPCLDRVSLSPYPVPIKSLYHMFPRDFHFLSYLSCEVLLSRIQRTCFLLSYLNRPV